MRFHNEAAFRAAFLLAIRVIIANIMIAKGLITVGSGIVAVAASFLFGWGPCGPASPLAFILFFGGVLAFLVGCVILSIGLIRRLVQSATYS